MILTHRMTPRIGTCEYAAHIARGLTSTILKAQAQSNRAWMDFAIDPLHPYTKLPDLGTIKNDQCYKIKKFKKWNCFDQPAHMSHLSLWVYFIARYSWTFFDRFNTICFVQDFMPTHSRVLLFTCAFMNVLVAWYLNYWPRACVKIEPWKQLRMKRSEQHTRQKSVIVVIPRKVFLVSGNWASRKSSDITLV